MSVSMSTSTAPSKIKVPGEYLKPEGLRTLANYLRSGNGVKVRSGIQHEKRVDYFKGKRLIECMLEAKKWPKSIPKITDKDIAIEVATLLIQGQFFHRSEKIDGKKSYLVVSKNQAFDETGRYTWIFAGNMTWSHLATGAVIAIVIGFTLLPIWPDAAKRILWYFSVTFLISTLAFCLIRFLLFLISWIFGYEFWIFPRLFDETLSFQDSFKPIYTFEKAPAGQGYYRIGLIILTAGFIYWATTQPTEFDGFIQAQRDFLDDLYSGNLLADVAQDHKDNIDRIRSRVPKLDELMREMEEEGGNGSSFSSSSSGSSSSSSNEKVYASSMNMEGNSDSSSNSNNNNLDYDNSDLDQDKFDDAMFEELLNNLPDEDSSAE